MPNKNASIKQKIAVLVTALSVSSIALADDTATSIDLTTGLAGVAILGGLMAAGSLKALPTYAAWGIRKALSMLR